GSGIGNEVAFYIFDYPPEEELRVRDFLRVLLDHIPRQKPGLRVKHVNLFDFVLDYLKTRKLLDKAIQMQREKSNDALKKALAGPLHPERLLPFLAEAIQPQQHDLVTLSGAGNGYPWLRTSSLLSNLQRIMGTAPLVMFYPGKYDQLPLRLYGKLTLSPSFEGEGKTKKAKDYSRAFKLVP